MKALGGRGIWEASLRLSLELVRVGPSEGELGGDMMNMVGGGGGPVGTEKIGSSYDIGLGSVANVKLMQGFGLSTNGGMSSKTPTRGTRGQRSQANTRKTDDLPSISSGGANSCSDMMQETVFFFLCEMGDGRKETRLSTLPNNRLFYERQEAARNGNRAL